MDSAQVAKLKVEAQTALDEGGHALGRFNFDHGPKTIIALIEALEKVREGCAKAGLARAP